MKKRTIWMIAAACAILLCGCSQSEEPVARTSDFGSTVEDSQGESGTASGHSFSESEERQPESSQPVEGAVPSSSKQAPEQPTSASASPKEQPAARPGNTAPTVPASSKQPASAGSEESEGQPETTPAPAQTAEPQPPAAPAEPEQSATEPPAPSEPPTPTEPPTPAFDVSSYVGFAQSYGQGIGLSLDSTATACWDDPLTANSGCVYLERDLRDRLDWYAASGFTAFCVWAEDAGGGNYLIYIGYA